ncbi:MAG TPA: hypothetical protein VFK04_05030 [Gemmatimonadaceae bacterium]|nr:hypothetical protein [Gemmatimonadaceae bacterium]
MYILTAQLYDEDTGDQAFARYQAYLDSVHDQMPSGALALATSVWYFNSNDHRAPHDAWLEAVHVVETPVEADAPRRTPRQVAITIRLLGAYHDGFIEFRYRDVTRYRIDLTPESDAPGTGHRDWRYDEFRLAPGGRVEHEIEWWGRGPTGTWLIEAADVEYAWQPFTARAEGSESQATGIANTDAEHGN